MNKSNENLFLTRLMTLGPSFFLSFKIRVYFYKFCYFFKAAEAVVMLLEAFKEETLILGRNSELQHFYQESFFFLEKTVSRISPNSSRGF